MKLTEKYKTMFQTHGADIGKWGVLLYFEKLKLWCRKANGFLSEILTSFLELTIIFLCLWIFVCSYYNLHFSLFRLRWWKHSYCQWTIYVIVISMPSLLQKPVTRLARQLFIVQFQRDSISELAWLWSVSPTVPKHCAEMRSHLVLWVAYLNVYITKARVFFLRYKFINTET